jgi:hypothetical protein
MNSESQFHRYFYRIFRFKWRNPFITASKILLHGARPRRVLGVWDFENGRAVIGDAFSFQVILLIVAEEHRLDTIDACFINPRPTKKNIYQITDKAQIENIISVCKVNPKLGSVFYFNDNDQFSHFFHATRHSYVVFPHPLVPFATVTNLHHLTGFFEKKGYLPRLRSDPRDLSWANAFIEEYCSGQIPVSAALRRNQRDRDKNAPLGPWLDFFDAAARRYPQFKFVVVGTRDEVVPELMGRKNLVFAKMAGGSTLLQDMALIEVTEGFLGHNSGISTYPWFIGKPSLLFGTDRRHVHWGHAISPGEEYNFLAWNQKHFWGSYTCEQILEAFEKYIVASCRGKDYEIPKDT